MRDPYVYEYSDVLKNLANIRDKKTLDKMEADYTCLRLAQIATDNPLISYGIDDIKKLHRFIFGDVYEWASEFRTINMVKEEPALGGISIEYSDFKIIADEVKVMMEEIQSIKWNELDEKSLVN